MRKQPSFSDSLPRDLKRTVGRTETPFVPAYIRADGLTLGPEERATIRQRLGSKLGKYSNDIERVSVRISDINGPRGGVDKGCRIKVVLTGLPSVLFESQAAALKDAIDGALSGIERAVRRSVQRRAMNPLKPVATGSGQLRLDDEPDQEA